MLYELTPLDILNDIDLLNDADFLNDADLLNDADERDRVSDRVNVPFPARVIVGDHEGRGALTAHLVNLSDGGAALRVYGRLEPGDTARLMIEMGREPIVICLRAVWTRNLPEGRLVGVRFERLTAAQDVSIAKLIADHKS